MTTQQNSDVTGHCVILRRPSSPPSVLSQRLIDHSEQLEDDRRGNVRHDAQREDREPAKIATGKQIAQSQQQPEFMLKYCASASALMPGVGNERSQTIDRQQTKREENTLTEIGNTKDVGEFLLTSKPLHCCQMTSTQSGATKDGAR